MQENTDTLSIDINCDLGEGKTLSDCEIDKQLMPFISSCNIACGGHAGNELTMANSLRNAGKHNLKIGAHPGYADKDNFGRLSLSLPFNQLEKSLKQQISSFQELALRENIQLHHIKFHGALYNDSEADRQLAINLVKFCKLNYPSLSILGLANGNMKDACEQLQVNFIAEGFMDRAYLSSGKLTPRSKEGAILKEQQQVINQLLALAKEHPIATYDHQNIRIKVDSVCLHGDNPNAFNIAKSIYRSLKDSGINIE